MAHPSLKKLAKLDPFPQSKTLMAQVPGRAGVLYDQGSIKPMKFANSIAALKWCETHGAIFLYLPATVVEQN